MQTVSLTYHQAFETAAVLAAAGTGLAFVPVAVRHAKYARWFGALLRETAIIGALYALWQLIGTLSYTDIDDAHNRAVHIRHWERFLPLPSEETVQHTFLRFHLLVQFANLYYATMHFTMMFVFLLWLFVRHRAHYRPIRQVLGWTTLGCLLVQFVAVAPPRMLPGIVDTAALYGQSVYGGYSGFVADQLSAMPSVHVAWAVLVGWYVWHVSPSRWRFIGPVHSVLTVFFVVLTGNHWWADGIVAVALLVTAAWFVHGYRALGRALLARIRHRAVVAVPQPELVG